MNFFEKELRSMFGGKDLFQDYKCCGNVFLAKLDDDLRIKLQFETDMEAYKYYSIGIRIINRTEGLVDCQKIYFTDVIGLKPVCGEKRMPHIWDDRYAPRWMTPITEKEKETIAEAISDYISMYQSEEIGMRLQ